MYNYHLFHNTISSSRKFMKNYKDSRRKSTVIFYAYLLLKYRNFYFILIFKVAFFTMMLFYLKKNQFYTLICYIPLKQMENHIVKKTVLKENNTIELCVFYFLTVD